MNKICLNVASNPLTVPMSCRSQAILPPPGFISPIEMGPDRRPPVYAFYNYHSVPLPPYNIATMFDYVSSRLQQSLDRIMVGVDPQRTSAEVLQVMRALPNCQLEFFQSNDTYRVVSSIWQQMSGSSSPSGTLLLISDESAEFVLTVKMIQLNGWKCVVVHPPRLSPRILSLVADSIELPIHDERDQKKNHVRLYERRRRRDSSPGQKNCPETAGYLHWNTVKLDHELVLDALQTRNDFPEELLVEHLAVVAPCSSHNCQRSTSPCRLLGLSKVVPSLAKKSKMIVRWKKDAVNHEKMADCTKNAQQCPKWNNKIHTVLETNCKMWHPHQACSYYPRCHWKAELCGFAHPFCASGPCRCPPGIRDPQKNHYIQEKTE